jgi:iron complex outermembrane receptor protein
LGAIALAPTASLADPTVDAIVVTGKAADVARISIGQTATAVKRDAFENTPAAHIGDIIAVQPGVTYAFGNGPRDISISVRGSNARSTFGVRNVQVFEDGFPVTQPDGLARTDLVDPHAYAAIDVAHGPSSALYGNYATGGAIFFRTRSGRDMNGFEVSADGGSDGYANIFGAFGRGAENSDYAAFASYVRGDGFTQHTGYHTATENVRATFNLTPRDRLTVKLINNDMRADLSIRLSYNQFLLNPYQTGCANPSAANCASVSVFTNGFNGARTTLSADQAGLKRDDRRTIVGARWEHDFDSETTWRNQLVWDNRDINQPTSATSAVGTFPSFNFISDVTRRTGKATWFAGAFANYEDINSYSYNVMPGGNATLGGLATATLGSHLNAGARARGEVALNDRWQVSFGIGGEHTSLKATQSAYTYPTAATPTLARVSADRKFFNVAPDIAIVYTPADAWKFHARVAAAYGTPQATNLFVTPASAPGNNTALNAQKMTGVDLGAEFSVADFSASVTGFYEFFRDELVSQSAGANLLSYTYNAPRSEHRGIEAAAEWRPSAAPGLYVKASYFLDDQIYKRYGERLSAGAFSAVFDRGRNNIPGVAPQTATARIGYDAKDGALAGFGGFVETTWRDAAYMDNANLLKAPGYTLVNANLYYDLPKAPGALLGALSGVRVFVQGQNLTDEAYVSSASNVADSISSATGAQNGLATLQAATGSIYTGQPRSIVAGLRLRF